jgi:Carboxypeptidase regulatory-like domain
MDGRLRSGTRLFACVLAVLLFVAGATGAFAQGQNGIFTGTVTDNDGVVPGAMVVATDPATGLARSAISNEQGVFRILSLPAGRYSVRVEMEGFKQINLSDVMLLSGETRDLGRLVLQVGALSEALTVTAEVTPVNTTTGSLQRNITGDQLTMIQVKGRDIFGMMKILPGISDTTLSRDYASWQSGRGLSINGASSLNKNTTIDGVPVGEEGGDGTTHVTPNIDAIGEVTVITNGYTAENGRQSSGLIRIVTKSGTNQLRGSGWYNARRDEWNANEYFRKKQGAPKPFFEVNVSGYSIGGPVVIPKLIDSRSSEKKVYFFLSQEFVDDVRPTSVVRTNLPTAAERRGDFSDSRIPNGTVQPIIDPRTGQQFPGNIIPQDRISPMGQRMLNLLPMPNGILNQQAGQQWTSNDAQDVQPIHKRTNFVTRIDAVLSASQRVSMRAMFDRDDHTRYNRVAPGIGSVNNMFPGDLITATHTKVLSSSMVHEMTAGFSHNHWGFRVGTGSLEGDDYTDFYRSSVGLDPPRLQPFGSYGDPHLGRVQLDEYPYLPNMTYGGGTRTNMATCAGGYNTTQCPNGYRPSGNDGPLPRRNENYRFTFQDDLSWTKGRHNFKFGFFTERNSKTEPGSNNYAGVYNFGHNADNPLSTGNGFANALLGVFTTYTELENRIDRERRHWQSDAYAQDSWRITPRFTLDYGVRVTHHGAIYEVRDMNSAFDPNLWDPRKAPTLYRPYCRVPAQGNQPCATANRAAIDPRTGQIVSQAYAGTTVPGSGSITNGVFAGGLPGEKPGWYYDMPFLDWGPRVGIAWDVTGDGKTAIRAAGGIFYNFLNQGQYLYDGSSPLIARENVVRNATLDDVTAFAQAGTTSFSETPQQGNLPAHYPLIVHGNQAPQGKLKPETYYQANVAFQRDIGFSTTAEIAWVGNFGRNFWRIKNANNIAPYAYGNPANLFNNEPIAENLIRRDYQGMGTIRYLTTDEETLNYNAMQLSVQRRLSRGLQMGLAYTLSKAEGIQGYDWVTEELFGEQGLRDRYYGPPASTATQITNPTGVTRSDRRHVVVINYSYEIPNPTSNIPILTHVLRDWEAAGVTQFNTGNPLDPICGTNLTGVANTDPSLSGLFIAGSDTANNGRCELTGEPLYSGFTVDESLPEEDRMHYNVNAFRRPLPNGSVGNFGNAKVGVLRHPGFSNWDFTLARRFRLGSRANLRAQLQVYNLFNQVEFIATNADYLFSATGNTSPNTGKYTHTTLPRNVGLTFRFDF